MTNIIISLLAAVLVLAPAQQASIEPAAMKPDVIEARKWLKKRMTPRQFRCLHRLWANESGWRTRARGPLTRWGRAYGIPQALPGRKMRSAGKDWKTNPKTQVRWGIRYIRARHGTPCRSLRFQDTYGWY